MIDVPQFWLVDLLETQRVEFSTIQFHCNEDSYWAKHNGTSSWWTTIPHPLPAEFLQWFFSYSAISAPLKVFGLTLPSGAVWSDGETFWLGRSAVHRSSHMLPLAVGDSHRIFQHVVRGNIPRWMHHERGVVLLKTGQQFGCLITALPRHIIRDAGKNKLGATCWCYYDVISPASRSAEMVSWWQSQLGEKNKSFVCK